MSRARFLKGCKLKIDGREFTLLRILDSGNWQMEATESGELRNLSHHELLNLYLESRCKFVVDQSGLPSDGGAKRREMALIQFEQLPPERQNQAKSRLRYVKAILNELGANAPIRMYAGVMKKLWEKEISPRPPMPHWTSVWRWTRRYLSAGEDIRALVDVFHRCGNKIKRLPDRLTEILAESIDQIFMTTERGTYQDVLDHALVMVAQDNRLRLASDQLPDPTLKQVRRMVSVIPAYDRAVARYGRPAAERRFRNVLNNTTTSLPLERVEMDHTRMDIFVVDEQTLLPLGRPWLTLCIDFETRVILGFDLSFEPPSHTTVARCLRQALLPKGSLSAAYPMVKGEWEMYGVMETLVFDNGPEFHSESLELACRELGITIQYCPRKQPWFKGLIERTLGSLNRGVAHGVPGTTFSNIVDRNEYDPSKHAVVTLATLREMIYVWICDYYHQRPHKGIGDTPSHAWRIGTAGMAIPVPADPAELNAHLGKVATRRLTHKGIEINSLFYNSREAGEIIRRHGHDLDVTVRFHDDDLGKIYILVPDTNVYVPVPAIDASYATGLTLWQHRICRRFARKNLNGRTDALALAEAKERIRELIARDFSRKKSTTNVRVARFTQRGTTASDTAAPGSALPSAPEPQIPVSAPPQLPVAPTPSSDSQTTPELKAPVIRPSRRFPVRKVDRQPGASN